MSGLLASGALYGFTLDQFQTHRKLVVFPLLSIAAAMGIAMYFLPPVLEMSAGETWSWISGFRASADRPSQAWARTEHQFDSRPFAWFALWYLLTMCAWAFVNVAFFSESMHAMNGAAVSLRRGFALAVRRLPDILYWALFASTIGMLIRALQERVPFFGQLLTSLLGFSWSVASQFALPVLLNEPRRRNPVTHLRISAHLIRRVWGDGLTGLFGVTIGGFLLGACLLVASVMAALATQIYALVGWGLLLMFICWTMQEAANGMFRCGLYIYATQGVAPGPFDADAFNRTWRVK